MTATRDPFALAALAILSATLAPGCSGCATPPSLAEPEHDAWSSLAACRAAEPLERAPHRARVASWNIRWFPDGTFEDARDPDRATDVAWAACTIARLDADVVAVQEFKKHERAKTAQEELITRLDELTGGRWQLRLDDCPHENQPHLGFLYDAQRVAVEGIDQLAELNPFEGACGGAQHPGLAGHFRFANGREATLVVIHSKSGTTPKDRRLRAESFDAMAQVHQGIVGRDGRDVIFLGDFNTNGCPDCDPPLSAWDEVVDLQERMAALDPPFGLVVKDNNCTQYSHGEGWPLDHVIAPATMAGLSRVTVGGHCRAMSCDEVDGLPRAHDVLSDHCPLVFDLAPLASLSLSSTLR